MAKKTIRTIPQERTSIAEQAPRIRVGNFDEVALGYTQEAALLDKLSSRQVNINPNQPVKSFLDGLMEEERVPEAARGEIVLKNNEGLSLQV